MTLQSLSYSLFVLSVFVLSIYIVKPYFHTIVFAGIWAVALQPLFRVFLKFFGDKHRSISLFSTVAVFFVSIFILSTLVVWALVASVDGYNLRDLRQVNLIELLPRYIQQANELPFTKTLFGEIEMTESLERYFRSGLNEVSGRALSFMYTIINNSGVFIINFFIWLFFLLWFLDQGPQIKEFLFKFSPMSDRFEELLWRKSRAMVESIMLGSVVISLAQGFVGGLFLVLFKVPNAFALTILMMILGMIPYIGGTLIMFLSAIIMAIQGKFVYSLGLLLVTIFIVSNIDNILRPKLVKKDASLPESLMLVGIVGGVTQFGILGLIYGPLVLLWLKICLSRIKS